MGGLFSKSNEQENASCENNELAEFSGNSESALRMTHHESTIVEVPMNTVEVANPISDTEAVVIGMEENDSTGDPQVDYTTALVVQQKIAHELLMQNRCLKILESFLVAVVGLLSIYVIYLLAKPLEIN